jgi:hypothetical protein
LALRTYRSNQWWDAKRKAYEKVIADLELCAHLNVALSASYEELRYGDPASSAEFRSEVQNNNEEIKNASVRLRRQKDQSSFIMSDGAQGVLNRLWLALDECSNTSPDEGHLWAASHYKTALRDFVLAARVDLKVTGLETRLLYTWKQIQQFCGRVAARLKRTKIYYVIVWIWLGQDAATRMSVSLCKLESASSTASKKPT